MSVPARLSGRPVSPFRAALASALAVAGLLLSWDQSPVIALATQTVLIQGTSFSDFAYNPSSLTVIAGDTVHWTNSSTATHSVTRCDTTNCPVAVGPGSGTSPATFDSGLLSASTGSFSQAFTGVGTYNYYCTVHGYTTMHGTVTVTSATPSTQSKVSTSQYTLANSDGTTWQDIDSTNLQVTASPLVNQSTLLTANADLWTWNPNQNQDIGIFVSDKPPAGVAGPDMLVGWKESGGSAGTFSPNAAFLQTVYAMTANHTYVVKLKWKTASAATGKISAGAGPIGGQFSPTSLTSETFPSGSIPNFAVSTQQYSLTNSDGTTWQPIDATNLTTDLVPGASGTAVLGANADLWTWNPNQNQDIGIFVADGTGPDTLVSWKESGGSAGTFSPNAAFVKGAFPVTGGHTYHFKLKWKTASAVTGKISAGAGPISGQYSPTSLFAQYIPPGANPYSSVSTSQYSLSGSDGATWQPIDAALNVSVTAAANTNSLVGANVDLWTWQSNQNQDIGIFAADGAGPDTLVAWKESGGSAGTFSPNAAFAQSVYSMTGGHTYVFKLKWKTASPVTGKISAGAGPWPSGSGSFSPTRLTVELSN